MVCLATLSYLVNEEIDAIYVFGLTRTISVEVCSFQKVRKLVSMANSSVLPAPRASHVPYHMQVVLRQIVVHSWTKIL